MTVQNKHMSQTALENAPLVRASGKGLQASPLATTPPLCNEDHLQHYNIHTIRLQRHFGCPVHLDVDEQTTWLRTVVNLA